MNLQEQLETFRKKYPLVRVNVYDDYMTYSVPFGTGLGAVKHANEILTDSGLNEFLQARITSHKGFTNDTFVIEKI